MSLRKNVAICVLSSRHNGVNYPWFDLLQVAKETWDSVVVPGVTTMFHLGSPAEPMHDRVVAFEIFDSLATLGHRNLAAFSYLLDDPSWDYLARTNSSCYVSKRRLLEFCQTLPDTRAVVGGVEVGTVPRWMWGGLQYIFSRDVVQAIVDNGDMWDHGKMEDVAMSHLVFGLGYDVVGRLGSGAIDVVDGRWRFVSCSSMPSFMFDDVAEIKDKADIHFIRVKQDQKRHLDSWLMRELREKYD